MNKFVESFDDFINKKQITEASEVAERNRKLNDKINKLKDVKDQAQSWKEKYEKLLKDNTDDTKKLEYSLLQYKKHKGEADMLEADIKLMKMDKKDVDKDDKEDIKKEIEQDKKEIKED